MNEHALQVITDTDRRGAQVFATDLHREMSQWRQVRTVALQGPRAMGGLEVPSLGMRRLAPSTLRRLREEIEQSHVVVGHGSSTLPGCALAGLGTGVPFVYRQISDQLFWAPTRTRRARVRAFLRRADVVVALWSGAADVLAERLDVPRQRIHVIPNGVPAARFPVPSPDERVAAKRALDVDGAERVVLSLGALVPEKGVDVAIRAIAGTECHLLVAGDGPERARLEALADESAPGSVTFVGALTDPWQALAASDLLVLPSRGGDSMPAVLIEAGLAGLPAVATPIGGIVEILAAGQTGELVPVDDVAALRAAVQGVGAQAESYGAAARQRCLERFEINVVARRWHALLDQVAATR